MTDEEANELEMKAVEHRIGNGYRILKASYPAILAAYQELAMYREAGEGVARIAAERVRCKREEGWTPEHDAQHDNFELSIAAACYAAHETDADVVESPGVDAWPWDQEWDKRGKHDRDRRLEIAGQLIAAELDRLAARWPEGKE